jgi:hypothetical protein
MFLVIGQSHPLMHDQNAGPRAFERVIICHVALERGVALFVFNSLGMNGRFGGEQASRQEWDKGKFFHLIEPINRPAKKASQFKVLRGLFRHCCVFTDQIQDFIFTPGKFIVPQRSR